MKKNFRIIGLLCTLCFAISIPTCLLANVAKSIYQEYNESILLLYNEEERGTKKLVSYGTAFAISEDGLLLTTAHLLQPHSLIKDKAGNKIKIQKILWSDEDLDLAVLQTGLRGLRPLSLQASQDLMIGEELTIISNPSGFQSSLSQGILSSKRIQKGIPFLQYTNPISPGSSGGPIFNEKGQVVGVVHGIYAEKNSQNLNFGVGLDYLPKKYLNNKTFSSIAYQNTQEGLSTEFSEKQNLHQGKMNLYSTYKSILSLLTNLINEEPESFRAYLMRGFIKSMFLDLEGAEKDLQKAQNLLKDKRLKIEAKQQRNIEELSSKTGDNKKNSENEFISST
ncbi:MAG TPA: serine protease, partial [Vampirovibrionales bacterium]